MIHNKLVRNKIPEIIAESGRKCKTKVLSDKEYVFELERKLSEEVHEYKLDKNPDELCDIADALGIGVCWDFGHAHIAGLRQGEAIEYIGKRLKVLHVNDNFGEDDIHLPPFCGNIDWKDAMHGLALAEFEGVFNFETGAGRMPASMREMSMRTPGLRKPEAYGHGR